MPEGIDKIIIKNFKAFPEEQIINLKGNNLLIYGENGSGKSSIYWALYTLFQAKDKGPSKTEKYFNRKSPENLLNVFTNNDISYIKISLTTEPNVYYVLDRKGVKIEGNSNNTDDVIVGINNSSDFISHRLLTNFYNYRNSSQIDLWNVFERDVLPFIKTNRGIGKHTLNSLYNEIVRDKPYKILQNGNIGLRPVSNDYNNKIKKFNDDLKYWISEINQDVNGFYQSYVQTKSEKKLRIELKMIEDLRYEFVKQSRKVNSNKFIYVSKDIRDVLNPFIKLSISIKDDDGNFKLIDRPQSFLNEAKLTAIAISIRFVLLQPHIRPAYIGRILVLDDLLISLDMSNRDKVTNLIFDNFINSYQTIILTHNRGYFNWTKHELENRGFLGDNSDWEILEMYVDEPDEESVSNYLKPNILKSKDELAIAYKHFKHHDYPAAANYLRKYAESIICDWLPKLYWEDKESREQSEKKMPFRNIINNGIKFLDRIHKDSKLYKELRKFIGILLNPLSHADVGVDRYKVEILSVFIVLDKIKYFHITNTYTSIISGGEEFEIRIYKPSTNQTFVYSFELLDSLYYIDIDGIKTLSKCKVDSKYCYPIEQDGSVILTKRDKFEHYKNTELSEAFKNICNHVVDFKHITDIKPLLFDKEGMTLLPFIIIYNGN